MKTAEFSSPAVNVLPGASMVYVAADGAAVGVIAISDALRQEAPAAVAALLAAGVRCAMLTGVSDVSILRL